MTAEKRRQMQKLKEKAVKLEQRLSDSKRRQQTYSLEFEEFNDRSYAIDNNNGGSGNSSLSEDMTELDVQRKEAEKSYMLLTDLLIQNENERDTHSLMLSTTCFNFTRQTAGECSEIDLEIHQPTISELNLMQRLQKLQKSETLIYDHRVNTIISPLSEEEVQLIQQQQQEINLDHPDEKPILQKVELVEEDKTANINFLQRQRGEKMLKKIPSICIDPPTPIISTRSFCDAVREQSSIDAINVNSPEKTKMDLNKYLQDEISSEESSNCVESRMNLEQDLKTHHKVTNITSKIIKFENYTGKDTKENSPKCSNIRPPQRSATSPSLKPLLSESSHDPKTKSQEFKRGAQKETVLVRSNSFTLDCPSKALIDHIRQQQVPNENYPTKRSNLFSMSATRDTVESKAKRVQKVDLKARAQATRLQVKPSVTNITSPSSKHAAANRTKRSPYEQKLIKPKIARQLKKSVSGTSAIKQMKPRPSMPSIQTAKIPTDSPRYHSTSPLLHGIEAEHRQKFLDLLAHQKREQQRMQQVFEDQQRFFFEQLSNKVSNMKIHNNVSHVNHQRVERDYNGSVDNSPRARSEYNESVTLQSPTISAHSSVVNNPMDINSIASQLPSLELSVCSSTMPTTSQSTPRRRLFSHDLSPSASVRSMSINSNNGANNTGRANGSTCGPSSSRLQQQQQTVNTTYIYERADEEMKRREAAATKINAHVRGYLVRRLFQTEQVQRIAQTIKDTLIFVLSLHIETCQDPVEANNPNNIKLKTQLVRQLTSAMHTLHLILFQTTPKERMEIISRDRKRIQTKMLTMSMKRSPRFQI
ncbi:uncharacterized protein DDB_G0284459 isoform X2 [Ceratitis capitata]|nr:uncharacterized protein DDB_G0284459 isoform X2 [Ceratitis capitata]